MRQLMDAFPRHSIGSTKSVCFHLGLRRRHESWGFWMKKCHEHFARMEREFPQAYRY